MDQSVLERTAPSALRTPSGRRRRRPGPAPRPGWSCENCTAPNAGSRKRCHDCGTTRD